MKVVGLSIFPIKSCAGIELRELHLETYGPRLDRNWVLVDEQNKFITQREVPTLARFKMHLGDESLEVTYVDPNSNLVTSRINLPFQPQANEQKEDIQLWKHNLHVNPESSEAHAFFSDHLKKSVRLMRHCQNTQRQVSSEGRTAMYTRFTDSSPIHVVFLSELNRLNEKLTEAGQPPITKDRFRGNILVSGDIPKEEDVLQFQILGQDPRSQTNGIQFDQGKPTIRCIMTTIDQNLGVKTGAEPLQELAKYKRINNRINFGMYYRYDQCGVIHVGDDFKI